MTRNFITVKPAGLTTIIPIYIQAELKPTETLIS